MQANTCQKYSCILAKSFKKYYRKVQKFFFREQWSLLITDFDAKILRQIKPPKDRIWADPFPVAYNGLTYIFIEQQIIGENGTLGYIVLADDLSHSDFHPILAKDHHLSYPNVFKTTENGNDVWWMVPESNENNRISLYRAIQFPDLWELERDLMTDICAVDTTLFNHAGKWWLFTSCMTKTTDLNASLFVFYSDSLGSGNWTPHLRNPVVVNRDNARMAGRIFTDINGAIMRPAQSCLREYGHKIMLNEIGILTEDDYRERTVEVILPEKKYRAVCTHTYNICGKYIVRDIKTRVFSPFHRFADRRH